MAIELGRIPRVIGVVLILIATCLCCAAAMVHFYGLHGTATLYPYKNQLEQDVVILRTALIAILASSWAIWFGARRRHSFGMVLLRTGLATQSTLTLYGVAGCGGVFGGDFNIAGWRGSTDFIFPATFFSEYNWLTFILQVAPIVAIAEGLMLYLALRCFAAPKSHLRGQVSR